MDEMGIANQYPVCRFNFQDNGRNGMTTEPQIAKARQIVQELQEAIGPSCKVHLDDWSDYASFRAFISLPFAVSVTSNRGYFFAKEVNLRKIGWQIKRVIHAHSLRVEVEFVEMPRQSYDSWKGGRTSKGYDNPYIMLDFRVFNC